MKFQHFFLVILIAFLKHIPLFFPCGYFSNQNSDFAFEFFEFRGVTRPELVKFLLVFIVFVEVDAMWFVFDSFVLVVLVSEVHRFE